MGPGEYRESVRVPRTYILSGFLLVLAGFVFVACRLLLYIHVDSIWVTREFALKCVKEVPASRANSVTLRIAQYLGATEDFRN